MKSKFSIINYVPIKNYFPESNINKYQLCNLDEKKAHQKPVNQGFRRKIGHFKGYICIKIFESLGDNLGHGTQTTWRALKDCTVCSSHAIIFEIGRRRSWLITMQ